MKHLEEVSLGALFLLDAAKKADKAYYHLEENIQLERHAEI